MSDPMRLFVIGVSSYISSLCYSVLRLEPWSTCRVGCVYCYARWYRGPHGEPKPQYEVERLFRRLARRLSRLPYPPPFFRLATLTEPLQDPEPRIRISLRLVSTALRHSVPIVLNTKLPSRLLSDEWLSLLGEMADRRLVLVQVSLSTLSLDAASWEPGAELPPQRLEAIRILSRHGIPVAVRVQPLLPGREGEHASTLAAAVYEGAVYAIGESIRLARSEVEPLSRLMGFDAHGWERYEIGVVEGREGLLHPPLDWRRRIHETLASIAEGLGAGYGACKEGFRGHRLPGDCCGAYKYTETSIRVTLHEAIAFREEHGRWPRSIDELCNYAETLTDRYICGEKLARLPRPLKRGLRLHEKMLERILGKLRQGDERYAKLAAKPLEYA